MQDVWLVHDDARIAPLVAEVMRSRGFNVVRVCLCQSRDEIERIKQEAEAPLIIRTAVERGSLWLADVQPLLA